MLATLERFGPQIGWHPEPVVMGSDRRSDEVLLSFALVDETAFAQFYARYERPLAAFFMRAAGRGELAADLTAELFAQALVSVERFDLCLGV